MIGTLCFCAPICKYEGLPCKCPGNRITWEQFMDVADAELIAEQEIWAAMEPNAKNQGFNCFNGDVFKWKKLWRQIAEKSELEMIPYEGEGFSLTESMKDKGPIWEVIVKENLCHTKIEEVGNWWFADVILNASFECINGMSKSKEYGFSEFCNTQSSFLSWIDKMKLLKIIP
ncbi:hypothetical protein SUGI_0606400 [Cryptomeria japonica]|nr:hypothetical protein SUGI_0606400 [Cryptomeria japonica]